MLLPCLKVERRKMAWKISVSCRRGAEFNSNLAKSSISRLVIPETQLGQVGNEDKLRLFSTEVIQRLRVRLRSVRRGGDGSVAVTCSFRV